MPRRGELRSVLVDPTSTSGGKARHDQQSRPGLSKPTNSFIGPGTPVGKHPSRRPRRTSPSKATTSKDVTASAAAPPTSPPMTPMTPSARASRKPKTPTTRVRTHDEPPIQNRFYEDEMPISPNQRLEQAIIFLSDHGPENYPDFEDKLDRIETHILRLQTFALDPRTKEPREFDQRLFGKVEAMCRVHRARIADGAGRFFEAFMFPKEEVGSRAFNRGISELMKQVARERTEGRKKVVQETRGLSTAELQEIVRRNVEARKKEAAQSKDKGKGKEVVRSVEPEAEDDDDDDEDEQMTEAELREYAEDPWKTEMPAKEDWYREWPAKFPWGETPYIEQKMSEQIARDLNYGKDPNEPGWLQGKFAALVERLFGPAQQTPGRFDLPPAQEPFLSAAKRAPRARRGGDK